MLKKLALFAFTLFTIVGCIETLPPVNFGGNSAAILKDTVYQLPEASIPSPDLKNILIEDLTGVRCSNCPTAAASAKQVKDTFGNRVVVLGLYPTDPNNLTFPYSGDEDLRKKDAQLIGANIYDFANQLPAGGVNRRQFSGQPNLNYNYNLWLNGAIEIYNEAALVNIELTSTKVDDSTYDVGAKFIFTKEPDFTPFVTIALLEDHITATQKQPDNSEDANYVHEHVFRQMYTPYNGEPLVPSTGMQPDRGVVVEKLWQVVVPDYVNHDEASVAVFLNYNDAASKEVLQCLEIKLK